MFSPCRKIYDLFMQLNQKVAIALLEKMGHSVVLAVNGQQAVEKWRATLLNLSPMNSQGSAKNLFREGAASTGSGVPNSMTIIPFDICLMDLSMPVCRSVLVYVYIYSRKNNCLYQSFAVSRCWTATMLQLKFGSWKSP